jgi:hypothetical protein
LLLHGVLEGGTLCPGQVDGKAAGHPRSIADDPAHPSGLWAGSRVHEPGALSLRVRCHSEELALCAKSEELALNVSESRCDDQTVVKASPENGLDQRLAQAASGARLGRIPGRRGSFVSVHGGHVTADWNHSRPRGVQGAIGSIAVSRRTDRPSGRPIYEELHETTRNPNVGRRALACDG